ncbi:uncharacterized protein LOC124931273 [Impatiens glandulifera]|uniref:uncharacterized protein LOC124931273 n=1 Tax=Impatiens glandulifera TaxID=253017 RepID=UPI001FB18A2D|nr:uncharacterized protein LOC124931273 [Impatiens glandulifera]
MVETVIVKKFPIKLTVAGEDINAVLSISFRFVEIRNSQDSSVTASQNHTMADSSTTEEYQIDSDDSVNFNSDESPKKETDPDQVKRGRFFSWKRRRLSFFMGRKKVKPSTAAVDVDVEPFSGGNNDGEWELKEFVSRDNKTILTSPVFLSSFDQCSEKAAGESACTALVTVISNWLHSHPKETPTKSQFDTLIIEGSSEWRKLCSREDLINQFPDKHFDMETVLGAGLRPVGVCREKSFVGFFGAEKFDCLKGFGMSFDDIWDKISENEESSIYIVSWNDHFFVLKVEKDVYYIIDTLGERLYEGCNQAFILRFDESSSVHRKVVKDDEDDEEDSTTDEDEDEEDSDDEEDERKEIVCRGGKESCKEFLKKFLAAIPLEELENEERKKAVPYLALHQRLQIEFDLTLPIIQS